MTIRGVPTVGCGGGGGGGCGWYTRGFLTDELLFYYLLPIYKLIAQNIQGAHTTSSQHLELLQKGILLEAKKNLGKI